MPHKDRATYLRYMRQYHDRTRGHPEPIPQASAELPPLGTLVADDDGERVQCHACGKWFVRLGLHIQRAHGLSPDQYREQYQLGRTLSLESPNELERRRQTALRLGLGEKNREHLTPWLGHKRQRGTPDRLSTRITQSKNRYNRTRGIPNAE